MFILLAFGVPNIEAQEMDPKAYSNAPVGLNFLIAGYAYAEGGVAFDPSVPLKDAHMQVHTAFLAYARSFNFWGRCGKFAAILPYGWVSGTAEFAGHPRGREVSGFGDVRFRSSVNFLGAPALSLKEFVNYRQDTIVGASLELSFPTGQYDPDKLVNIGTNRWSVKPELGVSKAYGRWTLEIAAGATFFSDNKDFLGEMTREQAPIYSVQGHLIYGLPYGAWLALTGTYFTGGRTTVDGLEGDDLQRNSRLGITIAQPVSRHHSVKFYAGTGVSTRTGSDFDLIGVAWQYLWGGGL